MSLAALLLAWLAVCAVAAIAVAAWVAVEEIRARRPRLTDADIRAIERTGHITLYETSVR